MPADAPRPAALPPLPADALARLQALAARPPAADGSRRVLLGLVGAPGAGKSTLAAQLLQHLDRPAGRAQAVPMDGFHLAQAELQRLGRAGRKGAPDTFDAHGYLALLRRLRAPRPGETVYAPAFHREIEEPVAGEIAVAPEVEIVITEGNYLLLADGPWAEVAGLLDETWYVEVDDALRDERLLARHRQFGRSAEAAREWVAATDAPNALRIAAGRSRADFIFRWPAP